MYSLLTNSSRQRTLLIIAAAGVAAAMLLAVVPSDVLAAVGGSSGGATEGAKNFKKNGLSSVQSVGVVVFAVGAIASIARGTWGGKVGQGLVGFGASCLGLAVSVSPEKSMGGIGGWATGLFEA